jgi:hypothetical protein
VRTGEDRISGGVKHGDASGAKDKVDRLAGERNLPREEKRNLLVEENVRQQIKHLLMNDN